MGEIYNDNNNTEKIYCAYCGTEINPSKAWPHVDGNNNLGVRKIDYFCTEDHKTDFFTS